MIRKRLARSSSKKLSKPLVSVSPHLTHVSEAERCEIFLFVCVCALRSVAHGQSKRFVPLTLTGKPNPAQITLWH